MSFKVALALAFSASVIASPVWACGAFIEDVQADTSIAMDAQRAIYHVSGERLAVTVQVTGANPSPKFAWIIPVPPDDSIALSVTDSAIFDELDAFTQPRISIAEPVSDSEGGGGCGSDAKAVDGSASNEYRQDGIDIFDTGAVGDYEFAIVGGDAAESITDWLQTHGYRMEGDVSSALEPYVDGGMRFVAVKFSNAAINSADFGGEPLVIDMARPETLMYPLALSGLSVTDAIPVLIYVIAASRYETSFSNIPLEDVASAMRATYDTTGSLPTYAEAVDAATASADGQLFVTDFSQDFSGQCQGPCPNLNALSISGQRITRLYANVPANALADVAFTAGSSDVVERYQFASANRALDIAWSLSPFIILLAWPRRRRL